MKRYLLFGGSLYYPSGGWEDFVMKSDEIVELEEIGISRFGGEYEWFHIVDTEREEEFEERQ